MPDTTEHTNYSAVAWARDNGERFAGIVALDNYDPTRAFAAVDVYRYVQDGEIRYVLDAVSTLRDYTHAVYLIDDGSDVVAHYVAAYHPDGTHVILCGFPTNVNRDGSPRLRANDRRPVDFSTWQIGPRRAYHVKVRAAQREDV